ncbi:hypothetical protein PGB90_003985 [Kerria lacca]
MGNSDTKLNFRKAVIQLTTKSQKPIDANDENFWDQFLTENVLNIQDVFTLIPASDIRSLREKAPLNLATLCNKAIEKLVKAVDNSCRTYQEQQTVLNCCRLLTRLLPYLYEDINWFDFFWSHTRPRSLENENQIPLAQLLLSTVCDLLFCPDFTVAVNKKSGPDKAEDLLAIDSCEYIWEKGVGFANSPPNNPIFNVARTELLKLLLTCFSEIMYKPSSDHCEFTNHWIVYFTSTENRHALPMFTSLLNTVCAYDPVGIGVPYNHLLFTDTIEPLVEVCLQILIVTLDHDVSSRNGGSGSDVAAATATASSDDNGNQGNLFINYLSRIHRDDDFKFIMQGFTRLLNNPLAQTYLPNSTKKIQFHQELNFHLNKIFPLYLQKFLYYVLKSSDVLDILVPILFHLNDSRADQSRVGLMHIGVFILLLLSGERNFGVRLNKPYTATIPMDISIFTGTHADLLITVFHKIITTGHQRLQPLFDCLLTILVNVSPYLKMLSMVASTKLLHLLEAFRNSNLVYTIIRKRQVFHSLANLPLDGYAINKCLNRKIKKSSSESATEINVSDTPIMEGSKPAQPAEPGTLKVTLMETPGIMKITERESAHPGNCEIPAELVSSNSVGIGDNSDDHDQDDEDRSKLYNKNYIPKRLQNTTSLTKRNNEKLWMPTTEWVKSWKEKLPLQTIMRLLQVLVPQVEKICIDNRGLTDESEILKFLQHGTLVGLLPVPHPILIRKYQANSGTTAWFRTYTWGVIYLRNVDPPICAVSLMMDSRRKWMKMRESMRITIFYRFSFEAMLKVKDNIKFASKNAEMRDY